MQIDQDVKKAIAKRIVAELAPGELELFDSMWAEFDEASAADFGSSDSQEHHTGFGGETISQILTLVIVPVVIKVLNSYATKLIKKSIKETVEFVKEYIDQLKRERQVASAYDPFEAMSDEQIETMIRVMSEELVKRKSE